MATIPGHGQPTSVRIAEREKVRGCSGTAYYQLTPLEMEFLNEGRTDLIPTAAERGIAYPERDEQVIVWPDRTPRRKK